MKIYISADIEGVAGITTPDEANPEKEQIKYFREQMTNEVVAACDGAMASGATEILIKDAHWDGLNINPRKLPHCARIVRGWTGHPYSMMAELDDSFDAVLYVGYHARAGSGKNPLAHTMNGRLVQELRINGVSTSEFRMNTFTATLENVPVAFLSGDQALCEEVRAYNEHIRTFATMKGVGTGTVSLHPDKSIEGIRDQVAEALRQEGMRERMRPLPDHFEVELDYKLAREAYGFSFYPGAKLLKDNTVGFKADDYFEVLRFLKFCIP